MQTQEQTVLITGVSRGLGLALADFGALADSDRLRNQEQIQANVASLV